MHFNQAMFVKEITQFTPLRAWTVQRMDVGLTPQLATRYTNLIL